MNFSLKNNKILQLILALSPFVIAAVILYGAVIRPAEQKPLYEQSIYTGEVSMEPVYDTASSIGGTPSGYMPALIQSDPGKLPYGFPTDLIAEKDITFRQSTRQEYRREGFTNMFVVYVSAWTREENEKYLKNYLAERGWEPDGGYANERELVIKSKRGNDTLQVAIVNAFDALEVQLAYQKGSK